MKRERKSNFELLRIVSMCGIIAIHYLAGSLGGMAENASFPEFAWFLSQFVNSAACPLVNCFVLISGYFMISKDTFCIRKSVDLLIITMFYGIIGYTIGISSGVTAFSIKGMFYSIFPFFEAKRWFVETYIILILLVPFINKALRNLDKKNFRTLLVISISIFSLWYTIGLSSPVLDDGYGIINFIVLYMLGAYLKLFGSEDELLKIKKWKALTAYIICVLVTFVLSYFIYPFGYAFFTNIIGAVFAFVFFMKLNIGANKKINAVSEATFDVYFVHSDAYTCRMMVYEILQGKMFVNTIWMLPHLILVIGVMWILGMLAFRVRKALFAISINKILDKIKIVNNTQII